MWTVLLGPKSENPFLQNDCFVYLSSTVYNTTHTPKNKISPFSLRTRSSSESTHSRAHQTLTHTTIDLIRQALSPFIHFVFPFYVLILPQVINMLSLFSFVDI